jgi:ankyrin repeat protein
VEALLRGGAEIEAQDADDDTPLHIAVSRNNIEMAKFLLNRRANINAKGHDANTALHMAASENNTDMVTMLLERGAETDAKDNMGLTALHIAVKESSPKVVALLLNKGAKINILDNEGNSAIGLVTKNANLELANLMLGEGTNVSNILKFKKNTRASEYMAYEHSSLTARRTFKTKLSPSTFKPEYNELPSSREILEEICIEFSKVPQSKICSNQYLL